jgi:hypothetical protein
MAMTNPITPEHTSTVGGPATTWPIEGIAASSAVHGSASAELGSDPASDHPGRWVGGAIGAASSLLAALVASRVAPDTDGIGIFSLDWTQVGLLGIPIGFVLGRQLLPTARSGGWTQAVLVGLLLGGIAPPLGAIEILTTSGWLVPDASGSAFAGVGALIFLPFALPLSYMAAVMTVPVGLAWGVAVRLIPASAMARMRAPGWLARLGVRHAFVGVVVMVVVLELVSLGQSG